jgi:F-type H+-transporting ATPase subunit delta
MVKNPKLATRYAQALYDFAAETENVEAVYHDILNIFKIINTHEELRKVLESAIIPQDKKHNITKEIFEKYFCKITFNFFSLIIKKRRVPQLLQICNQYIKIYYRNHHIKEVYITSAQPLSEKLVQFIKTYLEKDVSYTVIIHLIVNPKMIGGLVIKIDDFYYDASVITKINNLKTEFSQNKYAVGF